MKLTKVLLGSSLAITAVAVPTTLTSCNQNWGSLTPFSIGSSNSDSEDAPYKGALDDTLLDADGKQFKNYLQSNYAIDNRNSINYAYSTPMKFIDPDETIEDGSWSEGTAGWYKSSDTNLSASAVDKYVNEKGKKVSKTVTNARNAALVGNIEFVNAIAVSLNAYISNAWQYQAAQITTKDIEGKNLNIAWGNGSNTGYAPTLNHGTKDGNVAGTNNIFYESAYALANLNGISKASALLRTSNINFNFKQCPIPSYEFANPDDANTRRINKAFVELLEGAGGSLDAPTHYTKVTKEKKDADENVYDIYTYEAVPVQIRFRNLTQRFLNPNSNSSFMVSDYFSTDDSVNKTIGKAWEKSIGEFTGAEEKPHFKTFVLNAANTGRPLSKKASDDRTNNWELLGSDFVGLVSYTVNVYRDHPEKSTAIINGLQYLFPAYFIDLYPELYKTVNDTVTIFDTKKLDKVLSKFNQLFSRSGGQGYIADVSKLNNESKNLLLFLSYVFEKDGKVETASFLSAPSSDWIK